MGLFDKFKKSAEDENRAEKPAEQAAENSEQAVEMKTAEQRLSEKLTEGTTVELQFDEQPVKLNYKPVEINRELLKPLTQDVAAFMYKVGITSQQGLSYFKNDRGIPEGLFIQHTQAKNVLEIREKSDDLYLNVIGMHAFGAGVYVAGIQAKFGHPVSEFTMDELHSIATAFHDEDPYGLALKMLNIPLDSNNKKVLDGIIFRAMKTLKEKEGENAMNPENLKAFMYILFNAGVSMIMLRKQPKKANK